MSNSELVYDNRLVRYLQSLSPWRNAEFSSEDAFTLYHLIQEDGSKTAGGPALPALGHAAAGAIASAAAKALVYPVNLSVTRLQVQRQLRNKGEAENAAKDADKEYTSVFDAIQKIYKSEGGLKAFYSGCAADVSKGILDSFLFFLAYNALRKAELKRHGGKQLPVARDLGVGILAGSLSKFVSTPIENVVVRQQTAALTAARDPNSSASNDSTSFRAIARQIHEERGIAGFWSGYSQSVVLTINPALTFAVDNILTSLLPKHQKDSPSPQVRFLVSALSKAIATASVYPVMLAKSRAQVSGGLGSDENPDLEPEYLEKSDMNSTPQRRQVKQAVKKLLYLFQSQYAMLIALRKVYRDEGLGGLYSGIEGEVIKGFLQHGLTMMLKERVQVGVIQTYYVLLKATRRWPEELRKAQEEAKNLASEAQERAANVGETVSEGARNLVDKARGE